jgi:hypothetical protein
VGIEIMSTFNIFFSAARSGLNERLMSSMDGIEYRRIITAEDLEPIIDLRRKAYKAHNVYISSDHPMTDDQDLDPRYFTFAVYRSDRLLSTLRIHIVSRENPTCNSRYYYPDFLDPLISQGLTFMDPTRFAVDPDIGQDMPSLPLITLRLGFLAAKYFETDYCLSMIKEQHMAFYRRVFKSTQMTPFKSFEAVHSRYALFSSPRAMENTICSAYPMFLSTETERRLLFQGWKKGDPAVLSVRPSASVALLHPGLMSTKLGAVS